jgi:xylose isomerase
LFIAHIGGMDAFALGLAMADRIIQDGKLDALKAARYRTFDSGEGAEFERGKLTLDQLAEIGRNAVVSDISGRQEMLMNMINQYLFA